MPVTPHHTNLFQNRKELHQFLAACKQTLTDQKQQKIVSISLKIPLVDPLAVLDTIAEKDKLHFYIEKGNCGEAIAAIDAAIKFTVKGGERFSQVQNFINSCLANTINTGDLNIPFSGAHFFCSFTFFGQNVQRNSPFPEATVFLPRWQVATYKDYSVIVANFILDNNVNIQNLSENICDSFHLISLCQNKALTLVDSNYLQRASKQILASKVNFKKSVKSAIESIKYNHIDKVVLSEAIEVISEQPFFIVNSLNNLRINYPDCYVFSTSNGKGTTFIGASPESLIRIHSQELETDALAGSAPRGKNAVEDAYFADGLLASEKERREHKAVSDFIVNRLSRLGMTPQLLPMPCLLQLSNIQHLWTPIHAKIPNNIHPLEILAELHPTPAVAGVPRDIACQLIRKHETFDRSLYAAPLGWIDYRGNSEFIVGIRSAMINSDRATLYAGAGIVAGSDPDKELAEIQLKLQALLKALV